MSRNDVRVIVDSTSLWWPRSLHDLDEEKQRVSPRAHSTAQESKLSKIVADPNLVQCFVDDQLALDIENFLATRKP